MEAFWAFLIILTVAFFLFVVLPSILTSSVTAQPRQLPPPPAPPVAPETRREIEFRESQKMLDTYFLNARQSVPEDYPRKPIGACPYSKPPSTDLPIVNTPMCVSVSDKRSFKEMMS